MLALKIGLLWLALGAMVVFFMYCCAVVSNRDSNRRMRQRRTAFLPEANESGTLERRSQPAMAGGRSRQVRR